MTRRWSSLPMLCALGAGWSHALSLAWPLVWGPAYGQPLWWLQLGSLAVLVGLLNRARTFGEGARLSWFFALAMLVGTFWWLFISMNRYGGLAAPVAGLAVVGLAGLLGLYYALAGGLYAVLAPASVQGRSLLFGALWILAELARVTLFTGFPWGEGGYAHVDGWARPLASWIGVHGLTFLAAWIAAAVAGLMAGRRLPQGRPYVSKRFFFARSTPFALLILVIAAGLTQWPVGASLTPLAAGDVRPPLRVTLLQGNIAQDEKFQPGSGVVDALRFYGTQLQDATTSLVVLPETALPMLPHQLPDGYWDSVKTRFQTGSQAALIGIPLGSQQAGYSNSVLGLKPGAAEPYRYDKHHLVPFGEFIPPLFKWFTQMMNIPLGDFNRGAIGQDSFEWMGERLAPNICYEDLFGEELAARFTDPAHAPTIFVNVSNIAWFGNSIAIDQHLHISRMRALEFARPMIRATNTGATVVIDAEGRVTHSLPRHTRGALTAEVQGRDGQTYYAMWVSRFGLWPMVLLALFIVALAAWASRRRPRG